MGNEMTMAAVVQNLRRLRPDIEIYGFTLNPMDTVQRHGIRSFPICRGTPPANAENGKVASGTHDIYRSNWKERLRRYPWLYGAVRQICSPLLELAFLNKSRRILTDIDLIAVAGTGVFTSDWGGARGFPCRILEWSPLCRFCNTKLALLSVGAGPLDSALSRRLIRSALSRTAYRSFRDAGSKALIESLGFKGESHVYPDLAFSLQLPVSTRPPDTQDRTVVIHGLPYCKPGSWDHPNLLEYQRYLDVMAQFTLWLLRHGHTVRLAATQFEMDPVFIKDLQERIHAISPRDNLDRLIAEPVASFEEVIRQLSKASIVVTSRFHGVIFSFLLGKPVLAVSYHPKIRDLAKEMGQDSFSLDINRLEADALIEKFQQLEYTKGDVSKHIRQQVDRYRHKLEEQYAAVLQL